MKTIIRFIICSTLCFLNISFCFGQEIEWQNTIGGGGTDFLYPTYQTTDGGFILGGRSNSNISGDKTENSLGSWDMWVIKLDATGNIEWQNTIGGSGYEELWALQQTPDGGYILGGTSSSNISVDKTENSMGGSDYWIVKIDSVGNIQWQNTIGGNSTDDLKSISQTYDGGYICGGTSTSNLSGDKTENNYDSLSFNSDYWIVKIDSVGNIQWQNTIGGDSSDYCYAIQQTFDLGYIVGGYSNSSLSGDKSENCLGSFDYWILKLDEFGNIQWQNTIGGDSTEFLLATKQCVDGGYVIGGYTFSGSSGDKTEPSLGLGDYWIVKLDSSGNILWENTIGGNSNDQLISLNLCDNGEILVGGQSSSDVSGDKTEYCRGGSDFWVLRLDTTGAIMWQKTIGGCSTEWFGMINQTSEKGCILSGSSSSPSSYDKTENCFANPDYWVVKLSDNFNTIKGKLFLDLNSNLIQDSIEPVIKNHAVIESNSGRISFSQQDGNYKITVIDTGLHSITTPTAFTFYNSVPNVISTYFLGYYGEDSLNDFAFQSATIFNDLCITITPLGNFRAGMNASYMINYGNYGTTSLSGDVIFFPFNNVTYVSSNVTPFSITTDSVIWKTGVLAPFQTGSIVVTVNVNAGTPIGALINSSVRIEPVAGDANPGCNYHAWEVFVTGSYDPNDILVSEDTLTTTQLATQPYLDYTIRFQNTGNDTAFTVKIINPIDTNKLNLSTIEFVNASHPVNLAWVNYNRNMEFLFENIMLPDSNINEPLSHGFVHYKIKPKTSLLAGDSVTNNAYIYFDFNAPIETNTAKTIITLPTAISDLGFGNGDLKIFPNPTKDELTIQLNKPNYLNQPISIFIYDVFGKVVLNKQCTTANCKLKTVNLSSGIYFVEVVSGKDVYRSKFVKE